MTLGELLEKRAKEDPSKSFLLYKDLEVSYQGINEIANRVGSSLCRAGVAKGDKVAVLLRNCPEFIYSWFGTAKSGSMMVPINPQLKSEEVEYILNDSESVALVAAADLMEMVKSIRPKCPSLKLVVEVGEGESGETVPFSHLLEGAVQGPGVEVWPEDDASIIYTSGTTGKPKGVLLTHRNYLANAGQLAEREKLTERDRYLCILPLFHVNAQVVSFVAPLLVGASTVLAEGFSPKEFFPALERYKATTFSGVPTVFAILLNQPDLEKYDLSSLRYCNCGAAPMPVELFRRFEEAFRAYILEGYGLTEGSCASAVNPIDGTRKIGSIGLPLSGQEMRIVDDLDEELPPNQVGEIVIRGDNVMKGYYRNPQATADTLRNGWLHTGDLGYVDEEGYFFIVGRKKEMIIRGGENIYPKEVEEVLYKHPKIMEAAVVGLPDPVWGEEVCAFIVLKAGQSLAGDEIIEYCKEHVADFKCPRKVVFRDSFPKTPTGKIQKHLLREEREQSGA